MFEENEVKKLFEKFTEEQINSDGKLLYMKHKVDKHKYYLYLNLSELNYLYHLNNLSTKYSLVKLKNLLHYNAIGYTSIIKKIGIPKATLSKLLNGVRNVKLEQLNNLFEKVNESFDFKITKEDIKEGE